LVAVLLQRRHPLVRHKHDIATTSTIPTVRAPLRHEFLAAKRHDAVPAVPGDDFEFDTIDHGIPLYTPMLVI
jgi:hypothetical protein